MLNSQQLIDVFESRPFVIRNADEYNLNIILDLFVDPTDGLISPFDYQNSIIKGRMGSGKTMYLKANHAYYLYTIVPCLIEQSELILPIYIKLSDFQNIQSPEEIYKSIIIKIIKEMASAYLILEDTHKLADIHMGMKSLFPTLYRRDEKIHSMLGNLSKLGSDEYIERFSKSSEKSYGLKTDFFDLAEQFNKTSEIELKKKPNPCVDDISLAYDTLLKPFKGELLILLDEVGSLNKSFFRENGETSYFETLMNQLRTLSYVRTKVAVYPQSYSDVLTETRYGDVIMLQEDVKNPRGYINFENRCISLIEKYIEKFAKSHCSIEDILDIGTGKMDIIEQLINASNGNMRRLVQLLDLVLNSTYKENHGKDKVFLTHTISALKEHARSLEQSFSFTEIDFLDSLSSTCKARGTCKFKFPNKSIDLLKYINKSSEYNIINLIEHASGRHGAVYEFDYAYCVYKEIPTHYLKGTERIDKHRSKETGMWVSRITTINDNIIEHSKIPGKIEGTIDSIQKNSYGSIKGDDGKDYFFMREMIIEEDNQKKIHIGKRIRFLPTEFDETTIIANHIEIL